MRAARKIESRMRWWLPWLALALILPGVARAEDGVTNFTNQINDLFNQGDFNAIADFGSTINPGFAEELTAQIPPAPPPTSNRKDKAGGAKAAAIIGAVMAFASCAMMMAAAQQMEPGPERTMMMAQALQQCGQGAANLANAGDNGNAENAVTSGAQMPQVEKAVPVTLAKNNEGSRGSTSSNNNSSSPSTPSVDGFQLPDTGDIDVPDLATPTDIGGNNLDDIDFGLTENLGAPKGLPAIDHPKITFNETAEEGGLPPTTGLFAGLGGGLRGAVADVGQEFDGSKYAQGLPDRGTLDGLIKGGDAPGGSALGEGKGGLDLNGLLGKFGKQDGEDGLGVGDIVQLPLGNKDASKGKRLNIFEYATYRYRRLTYDDGRIRTRLVRTLASSPDEAVAVR